MHANQLPFENSIVTKKKGRKLILPNSVFFPFCCTLKKIEMKWKQTTGTPFHEIKKRRLYRVAKPVNNVIYSL